MAQPNYSDNNIKQMTFVQHIRAKTEMYVRSPATLSCDVQLFKEIIDNSADESIDPNRVYQIKILVFHAGTRYQIAVIDHGRGIPAGKLATCFTTAFTSGKYTNAAYGGVSTGTFGVGSKAVAALSDTFVAYTKRNDAFAGVLIRRGEVVDYQKQPPIDHIDITVGSTVFYEVDQSILKSSPKFIDDPAGLQTAINLLEYLTAFKQNTIFEVFMFDQLLTDEFFKQSYQHQWQYFQTAVGKLVLRTKLETPEQYIRRKFQISSKSIWQLMVKKQVNPEDPIDTMGYDIGVYLAEQFTKQNGVIGAINFNMLSAPTDYHICGLVDMIKKKIAKLFDDEMEVKTFFITTYRLPIYGYVNAFYKGASFEGQTKDAFKNAEFLRLYTESLMKAFRKLPETQWDELYYAIAEDVRDKFIRSANREVKAGRGLKNAAFDMNNAGCYIPCKVNDNRVTELFITEGNSAGDYVRQVRDPATQAILKMRGKPINACRSSDNVLKMNKVYQDMVRLFGVGKHDTDLSNFNYKSIGLLADADPDGYHILTLLIGNIYKINPLILTSGRVWIANPPLYVMETKNASMFMRDQRALDDARISRIYRYLLQIKIANTETKKVYDLDQTPDTEYCPPAYRDWCYLVKRIGTIITDVANKLVIDPFVLEQMIHCVDFLSPTTLDCRKIAKIIGADDVRYHNASNSLIAINQTVEVHIPLDRLVYEIRAYILPELKQVHWDKLLCTITTKMPGSTYKDTPVTFMQLYQIFEQLDRLYPVHRLKGLGECTVEQLERCCIDPQTRTFTTITSIGDVTLLYNMLGACSEERKKLVIQNLREMQVPEDAYRDIV